ncbi:hypothetical protein [Photobacterium piscicola]|uniref:Uncharacterized protein n=1 Tax=Photobacterium piscicola TaxID=1378299 RepID=A0ABU6LPI5_9GAMM|nr:hypothetical protein [Photobacterium piscicola]
MSKQRKITNVNLLCSEDANHVMRGNRTLSRKDAEAIRKYLNGEYRNVEGVKTLTTKPITSHVTHNNVTPDLFINDGSRMIVGVYLTGEFKGLAKLAKLAYLVGRTWKTVNGSINYKTDVNTGSTYYSITFYALQPPLTETQAIAGSRMNSDVSTTVVMECFHQFCLSRGFDPDFIANTQLGHGNTQPCAEPTIDDLIMEIEQSEPVKPVVEVMKTDVKQIILPCAKKEEVTTPTVSNNNVSPFDRAIIPYVESEPEPARPVVEFKHKLVKASLLDDLDLDELLLGLDTAA